MPSTTARQVSYSSRPGSQLGIYGRPDACGQMTVPDDATATGLALRTVTVVEDLNELGNNRLVRSKWLAIR